MIAPPSNPAGATEVHPVPHVCVCVCTFKRPAMLQRLLEKLQEQTTGGAFTFSVVVADNDAARSAESLVTSLASRARIQIKYCNEPRKNIALVRNAALANAHGEFIAFIDDDEFPVAMWLAKLLQACEAYKAAGVLGPVRPHFDEPPPAWLVKGRFCERPEHDTGVVMKASQCRTGNVLFRAKIIADHGEPFRAEFGTGGEDIDFFERMTARGCTFVWCNEAVAYETVPPSRQTRSYMLSRALLRGRINLTLKGRHSGAMLTSFLAVPLYTLIVPFSLFFGQHVFMNYSIRFCDHLGRVLALLGLNPVNERST